MGLVLVFIGFGLGYLAGRGAPQWFGRLYGGG